MITISPQIIKKYTFLLATFFIIFSAWQVNAQRECGIEDVHPQDYAQLLLDVETMNMGFAPGDEAIFPLGPITVPFQPQIIRNNAGTGGANPATVLANITAAAGHYVAYGILLDVKPILYVNRTDLLTLGAVGMGGSAEGDANLPAYNVLNHVNAYFIPSILSGSGSGNPIGGYARFPWMTEDYFTVANGNLEPNGATVAHEMGHYFGLLHTFETALGAELVDGSNCGTIPGFPLVGAGDLLCDTPADPNLWGAGCTYGGGGTTDTNGDVYNPDSTQIMSYNQPFSCVTNFSADAEARMRFYMGNDFPDTRSYLFSPTANCQDITVSLDAAGNASISGNDVNNGSTDPNGAALTFSVSPSSFNCADIGANTVTLTVTNSNGFSSTCAATVTVTDNIDPVITCPADITVSNTTGFCSAVVSYTVTSSDNCVGETISQTAGIASGGVFLVGTTTNTFLVTDTSGNTTTCSFDVTVNDTEPLVIVCRDITVQLDANGDASITAADIDGGSSDNCGIASLAASQTDFDCSDVGPNNVTLSVTDLIGNVSTCVAVVTVVNDLDPTITCPADITQDNDAGVCGAVVTFIGPIGTDNCVGTTIAQIAGLVSGATFPVGTTTNTFEITDASGNTATCSFDVTVNDIEDPTITCPADITQENDAGVCGATVTYAVTTSDNCTGETVAQTAGQASGTVFPVGTTTNTFIVTDASGNTATCSFDVTVNDTEDPTIACPADITINNDAGVCGATVTYTEPIGTDNCAGATTTQTAGLASGATFPVGTTTNTFVVTDASGNTATCSFEVIVNDTEDPTIICPADITQDNDAGACAAIVTFADPTATDNCGTPTPISLAQTNLFVNSSLDCAGYESGHLRIFDLTTEGVTGDFEISSIDVGIALGNGLPTDLLAVNIYTDNQVVNPITAYQAPLTNSITPYVTSGPITVPAGNYYILNVPIVETLISEGSTIYVEVVTDAQANFLMGYIDETIAPTGETQPGYISCNSSPGLAYNTPAFYGFPQFATVIVVNGNDIPTIIVTQTAGLPSGSTFPVGTTTNTFVVTDPSGNTATCSFDVTVNDTEDPTITCLADITQDNDTGVCGAVVTFIDPIGTDNCAGTTTAQTAGQASGTVFPVGTTTNTFVVTDASGNTATCSFDVTVTDNEPPVAVCADITIQLDSNGDASITAADVDGGSTDNCGIASLAISQSTFTCADVGPNNVTLTVTDVNGNVSTCVALVTIEDNVIPEVVCLNIDAFLDATGSVTITAADVDGGSNDACGIASIAIDIDTFTCDTDLGPNDVTLTVTDNNGNVSTCIAVVTVIDAIAPVIVCAADIVVNTDPGQCSAVVFLPNPLAFDNCTVTVAQTAGLPSGSIFPIGVNMLEYTATDSSGNTTSCNFMITVIDNEPAITVCQDITIQLDANGDATITAADVDGGSTDNCGIASIDASQTTFDCSHVGPNDITLTVTDVNGNVSTCIAVVTVEDNVDPVAVCLNITVELDVNGTVTITPAAVDGGSTDTCGIASYELDIDTFTCADVGDNPVELTVTDVNGNMSTCTAIVTVEDNIAPDLVCMDITVELDEFGMAQIVPEDVMANNTDVCGISDTAVDIYEFDCDDIGIPVTVIVFSQDANGNTVACTALVTVVDLLAPELTCPADQTVDPGPGNLFYEVPDYFALGEATAVDNCTDPLTTLSQDPAPGDLITDGVYTVTIAAEDEYGNLATCTFQLTVDSVLGVNDNDLSLETIGLYPNPAQEYVTLSNPQGIDLEQAVIYDMNGRLIQTIDLTNMGTNKAIDVSNLSAAVYYVTIRNAESQIVKQLLKK